MGLILEGRAQQTRRLNSRLYNRLQNVHDAMPNSN